MTRETTLSALVYAVLFAGPLSAQNVSAPNTAPAMQLVPAVISAAGSEIGMPARREALALPDRLNTVSDIMALPHVRLNPAAASPAFPAGQRPAAQAAHRGSEPDAATVKNAAGDADPTRAAPAAREFLKEGKELTASAGDLPKMSATEAHGAGVRIEGFMTGEKSAAPVRISDIALDADTVLKAWVEGDPQGFIDELYRRAREQRTITARELEAAEQALREVGRRQPDAYRLHASNVAKVDTIAKTLSVIQRLQAWSDFRQSEELPAPRPEEGKILFDGHASADVKAALSAAVNRAGPPPAGVEVIVRKHRIADNPQIVIKVDGRLAYFEYLHHAEADLARLHRSLWKPSTWMIPAEPSADLSKRFEATLALARELARRIRARVRQSPR